MNATNRYIYFTIIATLLFINSICENDCDFYLAPSLLKGAGRGIFTGKSLKQHHVLEVSPTLIVHKNFCKNWSLDNYIYMYDENYSLVIFGMAMLYNHNIPSLVTAGHAWDEDKIDCKSNSYEPNSICTNVNYYTKKEVNQGDEIFTSYGVLEWFTSRNISFDVSDEFGDNIKAKSYKLEELSKVGFCLSDTYVGPSSIPMAGRGLFAKRNFKKGEIVTISPALFLPKHEVIQASQDSTILNYCIASMPYGDVAVFAIGSAAMINHQMSTSANVKMQWQGFNENNITEAILKANLLLSRDPSELEQSSFSPIDIAYVATRNIKANEEITMNYGEDWINAWSVYLIKLIEYLINNGPVNNSPIPKFRYPIQPPSGFYPSHWYDKNCLGKFCFKNNVST